MSDWDFPTMAFIWDYRTGAIMAGADKLDALSGDDRQRSLAELTDRVRSEVARLEDGWLVMTSFFMVDDIYKSFFRDFGWSSGVEDYLAATAGVVIEELSRRGMVLHYVVDNVNIPANLEVMLAYLPAVFQAAGMAVIGPQIVAQELLRRSGEPPSDDLTEIQRYRDEGHQIADEVVARWHAERQSTAYLNLDFDDDAPGLSLDAALAPSGAPRTIVVYRSQAPAEGSAAGLTPPPDVVLPPEVHAALGSPGRLNELS